MPQTGLPTLAWETPWALGAELGWSSVRMCVAIESALQSWFLQENWYCNLKFSYNSRTPSATWRQAPSHGGAQRGMAHQSFVRNLKSYKICHKSSAKKRGHFLPSSCLPLRLCKGRLCQYLSLFPHPFQALLMSERFFSPPPTSFLGLVNEG